MAVLNTALVFTVYCMNFILLVSNTKYFSYVDVSMKLKMFNKFPIDEMFHDSVFLDDGIISDLYLLE